MRTAGWKSRPGIDEADPPGSASGLRGDGRAERTVSGSDDDRYRRRACPNLVEAGAAVDRPIVPGSERDHRLATATAADRGVEFARSPDGPSALGDGPTRGTSLGVVEETLAGEEGLLSTREGELTCAIAAREAAVLEHACLFLLLGAAPGLRFRPSVRVGRGVGADRRVRTDGSSRARTRNS
jgi:hypothetical protein